MIYDTFKQPELMMQLKGCEICSIFASRMAAFKISMQDVTKFLPETSELPRENVLDGLYKMKLQGSDQLQGFVQSRTESRWK